MNKFELITLAILISQFILIIFLLIKKKSLRNEDRTYLSDHFAYQFQTIKNEISSSIKSDLEKAHHLTREDVSEKNNSQFQTLLMQFTENYQQVGEMFDKTFKTLSANVDQRLDYNSNVTNKSLNDINSQMTKIYEAQRQMEAISKDINNLQSVLTDKKSRGIFGEAQLYNILENLFGAENKKLFEKQKKIGDKIADAVVYLPNPVGMIAIDSKFPLENYRKTQSEKNKDELIKYKKMFQNDMKKHIDAISSKYIVEGVTADLAILFLPVESLFSSIIANHSIIIEYAMKNKVWICSPTTITAVMTILQSIFRDIHLENNSKLIREQLLSLKGDFERFNKRWEDLYKHLELVQKDADQFNITCRKIDRKLEEITIK